MTAADKLLASLSWLPDYLKRLFIVALHEAFTKGYREGQQRKENSQ